MEENTVLENILKDWTECNAVCDLASPFRTKIKDLKGWDKVDYYMEILPGADYVRTQTLNYIFSNGLTTGSINQDVTLDDFLYRVNADGINNLAVLWNSVGTAISHGSCGLRWYEGNIYRYDPGTYRAIKVWKEGVKQIAGYIVSTNGKAVTSVEIKDEIEDYADILQSLKARDLMLLDTSEFIQIRNDTSLDYGYSPLLRDELRLDLLVAVYERLNYDIRYDGPGRIIIRPKEGYPSGEDNDISTSSVLNASMASNKKRIENIKAEADRVSKQIAKSSSDAVIVLSNAFDKNIEHLDRVTKATEFMEWIENEGVILAQDFGMSPSLLELGGISGNVSMTSIIDNAMLNSIVPLRERYATQFSPFLSEHLGLTKVYYNKYEMQQTENENTMRTQIANVMTLLNSLDTPKTDQLVQDFADMLSDNIHNENNQLEEL